ncbi:MULTISPECIES: phage major capsid protein [Brucella]|uniref:phage major capsid protein n=1 Tax=Brucella TaxID=234 RepID=UPI000F663512|nr:MULTISPECIES: phage major capsid protein [Brucella]QPB10651.1 major capsid protein [Bacteriophage sp. 103231]KAB2777236.1 phage major capsid protein [Brucella anthropi]RRY06239.1 phage major capsid protein [Brucella anthropi]UGQ21782.1 phage major capsid protein [Brucella anthropi]UYT57365.1 phage major capsid protein [Brucella sp. MAB-22]
MEENQTIPLEIKSVETKALGHNDGDVSEAFDEFMTAFSAFREANDERLKKVEKGADADVLLRDKVDRINRALDEQKTALDQYVLKQARPPLGGGAPLANMEHKQAFDGYVRRGDEQTLRGIEQKAHSYASGPDGGYLVPAELETEIGRRLAILSPIRGISSVRQVSGAVLKKPFSVSGPATGWVGETDARPQTASAKLAELQFPTMEIYAMPAATSSLLDDAAINVEQWIAEEVEAAFAEQEGAAFVNGDGVNKPRGFLNYESVADNAWVWGKIGHIATGVAGALPEEDPSDKLIELIYGLRAGYRQNANFVMNRKTQSVLRKLKDKDGNYLWQPPSAVGEKASLMGFGLVEAEHMPDIAADSPAIAFGDFGRGYLVVDRIGVRVLRDPYSAKPYVLFYTTKRVGGGVQDFEAIKLLKFSA